MCANAQKDIILGVWTNIASMILAKSDLSAEDQAKYLQDTLAFDEILGGLVKTSEEWSEYVEMYNPMKTSKVASMLKPMNFKTILKGVFNEVPDIVVVAEPRYVKNFTNVFNENTFEEYKHWAYVTGLVSACPLLSEELMNEQREEELNKIIEEADNEVVGKIRTMEIGSKDSNSND